MSPRTRLDPLLRLRVQAEDSAHRALAEAQRLLQQAQDRFDAARQRARAPLPAGGKVEELAVAELARERAEEDAHREAERLSAARTRTESSRENAQAAHREADVARRAVERKRALLLLERERKESRELDAMSTLRAGLVGR